MSGGARYWNEETQRWEDTDGTDPRSAPVTSPPPPTRPAFAPTWTAGEEAPGDGASESDAQESGVSESDAQEPGASESGSAATGAASGEAPAEGPSSGPAGWPGAGGQGVGGQGAGGQGGWHGPASAGSVGVPAGEGAWSATEVTGGGPASSQQEGGGAGGWPPTPWPSQTWPPATGGEAAAPAPARGMSRRLVWSVVTGAAALGVAVSLVLTLVVDGGNDKDEPSVAASESPSSPPAEASQQGEPDATVTEETALPSASAPELPAGYESYEDGEGFRIARPKGWTRSTVPSQYGIAVVNYRSADGERRLQVYQVSEETPDASFDLYLSDQTAKPAGFKELSRQNLDDAGFTGSRLEYLADSIKGEPDVGTWHVYDERFVAADGSVYAIAAYGPDADGRDDELRLLTTALDHFCPPYACDPASVD
jgi:hypothetical protein